jgi:hypothetical protein
METTSIEHVNFFFALSCNLQRQNVVSELLAFLPVIAKSGAKISVLSSAVNNDVSRDIPRGKCLENTLN